MKTKRNKKESEQISSTLQTHMYNTHDKNMTSAAQHEEKPFGKQSN